MHSVAKIDMVISFLNQRKRILNEFLYDNKNMKDIEKYIEESKQLEVAIKILNK